MWSKWDSKATIAVGGAGIGLFGIFTGWYAAKRYYSNAMAKTKSGSNKTDLILDMSQQHEETIKNLRAEIEAKEADLVQAQEQKKAECLEKNMRIGQLTEHNKSLMEEIKKNQEIKQRLDEIVVNVDKIIANERGARGILAGQLEDCNKKLIEETKKNKEINQSFDEIVAKAQEESLAERYVNRYKRNNPGVPLSGLEVAKMILSAAAENISLRAIPSCEHENTPWITRITCLRASAAASMEIAEIIEE
jgi:hypothetical protein